MLTDEEEHLVDTVLDEMEISFGKLACKYDDFFDLCSPENINKESHSAKSNEDLSNITNTMRYSAIFEEDGSETYLDENKIFQNQTQCIDLFNKIEHEVDELSSILGTLNEVCEGLEESKKNFENEEFNFREIKKDFLKHKELMRNVATKVFTFNSEEFLYLLNELLKNMHEDNYLDLSALNISDEIIEKLLHLQLIERDPSDPNKISLCLPFSVIN